MKNNNLHHHPLFRSPLAILREGYYPFNISGSYTGSGCLNYTQSGRFSSTHVTSAIRIRTSFASDNGRYHAVKIRFVLNAVPDELRDGWNASTSHSNLMLEALGIYDAERGKMQAIANSPTYPPKLSKFEHKNISWPRSDWSVSPTGSFHPSICPFLVDVTVDNISKDAFNKENIMRKKRKRHSDSSDIQQREYIDVHLKASILSMSESCTNITQSIVHGHLLRYDQFILKTSKYAQIAIGLSFFQLLLIYRQTQFSTPGNVASKLSLTSVAMHSVFDAYLCLVHLITALYIDDLFYPFVIVFFLQFIVFSVFDLRLVLLVCRGRRPLDFSSGWERVRSTLTKIYLGFYGGVLVSLLLLYYVRNQISCVVFLLFAFWVPQIVHNIKTGDKFAVQGRFLFGVSAIKLFFPLYVFGCPHNFLEFTTNTAVVVGLLSLVVVQVFILKAQDIWGSRFFIPKRLQPDYYEYHRTFQIDPDDDETCAICMSDIISSSEDPTIENEKGLSRKIEDLAKNVLTTPCNHRFCRECLVRWMETKMICPTCRGQLPPYYL